MPSSKETVTFLLEQLEPLDVRAEELSDEYGLYCDDKLVGVIADELLFVAASSGDGPFARNTVAAAPFPEAGDHWLVSGQQVSDTTWLRAFIQATADALPERS